MGQRANTLTGVCKCGCGKTFKPKRKDQVFYNTDHKKDFTKRAYELGRDMLLAKSAISKKGVQVGMTETTHKSVTAFAEKHIIPNLKKKKTFNARNVEGSKPLQRMLKLFNRGGKHSTMALNNYLTVTCASTMASELNWNFNKRHDLPEEYKKYRGMEIVSSTKRLNKKTVWFYKLERCSIK